MGPRRKTIMRPSSSTKHQDILHFFFFFFCCFPKTCVCLEYFLSLTIEGGQPRKRKKRHSIIIVIIPSISFTPDEDS